MYSKEGRNAVGFAEVLTLIFVVLKLNGTISWSWWLVMSPMIAIYGIGCVIGILTCLVMIIFGVKYRGLK